jgi:hypothetical protein
MNRTTSASVRSERGVALAMALGTIIIIGVIVAGAIFVSTHDYRRASNTVRETRAVTAADLGLNRLLQDWNPDDNGRLITNDTVQRTYNVGDGTVTVLVTRLPGKLFWMLAQAQAGGSASQASARRRYGMLLRIDTPDIPFMGALTGRGSIRVGGSSTVNGKDGAPTGWTGCSNTGDVAGIAMSDTTSGLKLPGCDVSKSCVDGSPKFIQTLLAADTATYFVYGNSTYQQLAASATKVVAAGATLSSQAPVVVSGVCQTSDANNWGDPTRAAVPPAGKCEGYYPVIHALGDLRITGTKGQGILLVDGDLALSGGFEFTGIIIVRGSLTSTGTGAKITGGVMAANIDLDENTVLGNSGIKYSSCAINKVMQGSAYLKPVTKRAWVDLR